MKFDVLCNIVLESKKQEKFAHIIINDPNPSFSMEDVLKDPDNPSKGVRTYLDEHLKGSEYGEPADEERIARRALRRLNWVVGSLIKRVRDRELDLRKLHINIILLLEKYLTSVLRYSEEQIEKMELKIAKEAAFIGNIILPPSNRYPNAKGVFTIAKNIIDLKNGKDKISDVEEFSVADNLRKEFNMSVDEYLAAFDPDLIGTIKDIIRDNKDDSDIAPVKAKTEEEPSFELDSEEGGLGENTKLALESVSISNILKDPRIKGVYDSRIVRKVIKSMISLGSIKQDENGELILAEPGEEDWRIALKGNSEEIDGDEIDAEDTTTVTSKNEPEEDIDNPELNPYDKAAATRLGYIPKAREESGIADIGEDEEDENLWHK
jgi:hypothetical protein